VHHVDHIIPIKGGNVCRLHVPWNLRIITQEEKLRKSNKFDDWGED
jgi:5-methylcytosine-specific restriction endonuclease McrA